MQSLLSLFTAGLLTVSKFSSLVLSSSETCAFGIGPNNFPLAILQCNVEEEYESLMVRCDINEGIPTLRDFDGTSVYLKWCKSRFRNNRWYM